MVCSKCLKQASHAVELTIDIELCVKGNWCCCQIWGRFLGGRQWSWRSSRYVDPLVPRGTRTGRPSVSSLTRLLQTHNNTHVEPQSPSSLSEPCYLTITSLSAFTIEALPSKVPLSHKHETTTKMTTQFNRGQTVVLTDHTQWIKWIAQLENKCVPLRIWHLFNTKQLSQPLVEPRAITRRDQRAHHPIPIGSPTCYNDTTFCPRSHIRPL
jgi:hypothetical protein